ncbi:MAG: hypothetical protein AAF828_10285, partial [Bacteroidota bacterium]
MIKKDQGFQANFQGTAQHQRRLGSLMPDHVLIDERQLPDLLAYAAAYAKKVKYVDYQGHYRDPQTGTGFDWSPFFEKDISVFLAHLITQDFSAIDETIQEAFISVNAAKTDAAQQDSLYTIVEGLLELSEVLLGWYQRAKKVSGWNSKNWIEEEIERALSGDLGRHFNDLASFANRLNSYTEFTDYGEWLRRISDLQSSMPPTRAANTFGIPDEEVDFSTFLAYVGPRLQKYYRKLYLTIAYLQDISPGLFRKSIEEKNDHDPDIGLFISFLQLFSHAQTELNTLTQRHLDYYFCDYLQQQQRGIQSDKTIVSFQLATTQQNHWLAQGTKLFAGVNEVGLPSHYITDRDLLITKARVSALKTLFISKNPTVKTGSSYKLVTAIYAAPVANSLDGLGKPFETPQQNWPILGEDQFDLGASDRQMAKSALGFAISSSVLLLSEGE